MLQDRQIWNCCGPTLPLAEQSGLAQNRERAFGSCEFVFMASRMPKTLFFFTPQLLFGYVLPDYVVLPILIRGEEMKVFKRFFIFCLILVCLPPIYMVFNNWRVWWFAQQLYQQPLPPNTIIKEKYEYIGEHRDGKSCMYIIGGEYITLLSEQEIDSFYSELNKRVNIRQIILINRPFYRGLNLVPNWNSRIIREETKYSYTRNVVYPTPSELQTGTYYSIYFLDGSNGNLDFRCWW